MGARIVPLGSGSQGNATLVEIGETRLLVDAGLSARALERRLGAAGVAPEQVDFILLSHEHNDHARGAERFSKRHGVPVLCGRRTLEALDLSHVHLGGWEPFEPGRTIEFAGVRVDPFSVPHDAADPVGFVVEGVGIRFGIVTDLGHATTLVVERLKGCDVLMVEANHDDRMLRDGPYPWRLKQRVGGRLGHLSNEEAASLVGRALGDGCRAVVLAHLSEHNNTPRRAMNAVRRVLRERGRDDVGVTVAVRDEPSEPVLVEGVSRGAPRQRGLFG